MCALIFELIGSFDSRMCLWHYLGFGVRFPVVVDVGNIVETICPTWVIKVSNVQPRKSKSRNKTGSKAAFQSSASNSNVLKRKWPSDGVWFWLSIEHIQNSIAAKNLDRNRCHPCSCMVMEMEPNGSHMCQVEGKYASSRVKSSEQTRRHLRRCATAASSSTIAFSKTVSSPICCIVGERDSQLEAACVARHRNSVTLNTHVLHLETIREADRGSVPTICPSRLISRSQNWNRSQLADGDGLIYPGFSLVISTA